MTQITSKPDHNDTITPQGKPTSRFQLFLDDIQQRLNDWVLGVSGLQMVVYAKANLPTPANTDGRFLIFVSDDAGGSTPAFWDGTNWRRTSDRTIIA